MITEGRLDIASGLANDPEGKLRTALLKRLAGMEQACAVARRSLQDRGTYSQLRVAGAAVSAAVMVLQRQQVVSGSERSNG
ncbi:MAG: hypothetical protein V4787_19500 [Pseudomonadota bacterium]